MHDEVSRTAVVVGAGIIGSAAALRLQQGGWRCTMVDPLDVVPAGASSGNAGHLAIEQSAPLASWPAIRSAPRRLFAFGGALDIRDPTHVLPWLKEFAKAASPARFEAGQVALRGLLDEALPAWQRMLVDIGRQDLIRIDGHIVLWESAAAARRGRTNWNNAELGNACVRELLRDELAPFEASIEKRLHGGLHFAGTGQVADPAITLEALRMAFVAAGGVVVRGTGESLPIRDGRAAVRLEDGRQMEAGIVLVTGGVRSGELLSTAGLRVPLIAERGYHIHWDDHDWPERMPPVVFEDRSVILTRFSSGLRLAGYVEFARRETAADPRKWAALRKHAQQLNLPVHGDGAAWYGARPTLPDYLPAIGRARAAGNLLYAFGHQHLGLTLAPITAELVESIANGRGQPTSSLGAFDLARFSRGTCRGDDETRT